MVREELFGPAATFCGPAAPGCRTERFSSSRPLPQDMQKATAVAFCMLAEREGFEPPVGCPTTVFKTAAFDHSATSPRVVAAHHTVSSPMPSTSGPEDFRRLLRRSKTVRDQERNRSGKYIIKVLYKYHLNRLFIIKFNVLSNISDWLNWNLCAVVKVQENPSSARRQTS